MDFGNASLVRLAIPEGTVIVPGDAEIYELSFPMTDTQVNKAGDDLVFTFQADNKIILNGFYKDPATAAKARFLVASSVLDTLVHPSDQYGRWTSVADERCIYSRVVNDVTFYQLQCMHKGKRYTDNLGPVSLENARTIRDALRQNRKRGCGPQSYKEMLQAKAEPQTELPRNWTVGEFWNQRYLPHREKLIRSPMDAALMKGRWKNHIRDYFADRRLDELSETDFENYVSMLRSKKAFGATTILHCLVDLRGMWTYAEKLGAVKTSFPGKEAVREISRALDNEKKCYLDLEEASKLVRTAYERRLNSRTDHDVYCYIVLGLGLGLRAGEIHTLTEQSIERRIIEKTKNRRSRFVHFDFGPVRSMLAERLELYPPGGAQEPLFRALGKNAKTSIRHTVPKKYYDLIRELGFNDTPRRKGHPLEKIDFHALRHTFATLAAMRGVDHLTLMRLMGHKTPAMTLRYIEIADAHQARYQEIAMEGIFPQEEGLPPAGACAQSAHAERTGNFYR